MWLLTSHNASPHRTPRVHASVPTRCDRSRETCVDCVRRHLLVNIPLTPPPYYPPPFILSVTFFSVLHLSLVCLSVKMLLAPGGGEWKRKKIVFFCLQRLFCTLLTLSGMWPGPAMHGRPFFCVLALIKRFFWRHRWHLPLPTFFKFTFTTILTAAISFHRLSKPLNSAVFLPDSVWNL